MLLSCLCDDGPQTSMATKVRTKSTKSPEKLSKYNLGVSANFNIFSYTKPNESQDSWGEGDIDITSSGALGRCRFTISTGVSGSDVGKALAIY